MRPSLLAHTSQLAQDLQRPVELKLLSVCCLSFNEAVSLWYRRMRVNILKDELAPDSDESELDILSRRCIWRRCRIIAFESSDCAVCSIQGFGLAVQRRLFLLLKRERVVAFEHENFVIGLVWNEVPLLLCCGE